ncbi:MAG: ADP-ribosylglycohydrolase family protein [Clostridiales bacterium]|nr:ADP-ribosylglycohydrolase family protein [Clostridiales bacterium]
MYGAIIGDIAGSSYEWHATKDKDFEWFRKGSRFTDDTVMTVAVAESLLGLLAGNGTYSPGWRSLGDWSDVDTSGESLSDAAVLQSVTYGLRKWGRRYPHAGYGGRFSAWLTMPHPKPYHSFGNGSAMRVSPAGWLFDDMFTTRRIARLTAAVTHDHQEGIKGAEAVAAAIFLAREEADKQTFDKQVIKTYIEKEFGYDLGRTLDEIRPDYAFDVSCQGSVPEAVIAFLESEDYESAVRNAVSLGGDADTQGAIAGSIAEAFYGVPTAFIDQVRDGIAEDGGERRPMIGNDITQVIDTFYYALCGIQEGYSTVKKWDAETEGFVPGN